MTYRKYFTALLALAALGAAACSGDSSAGADNSPQGSTTTSSTASGKYGQVTITGAVKISTGFLSAQWSDFPGDLRADLSFGLCTVVLEVPHGTQPGTYPITDQTKNFGQAVSAQFGDTCNGPDGYGSTSGTLTLTSVAPTWAGTLDFDAQNTKDSTKTVHVTGTFKDVPKV